MSRRLSAALSFVIAFAITGIAGCARIGPDVVEVGHHRVRVRVPQGWQRLDHGRVQLFRKDEAEIALMDRGPANRAAIARDLRNAQQVLQQGRWRDAIARVRELEGAPLAIASAEQSSAFWGPWHYGVDSTAIEAAIEGLIARVDALPEPTADSIGTLLRDELLKDSRRDLARMELQTYRLPWFVIDTWDRTSHMDPSRLAWTQNGDDLLVLTIVRRRGDTTDDAFQALLGSIEPAR